MCPGSKSTTGGAAEDDDSDDEEFVPKATTDATAPTTEAIPNAESGITKVEEEKTDPTTAK